MPCPTLESDSNLRDKKQVKGEKRHVYTHKHASKVPVRSMTIKAQTCHSAWDLLLFFSLSFIYTSTPSSHCFLFLAGGKTSDPCGQCHDGFLWSQLCVLFSKRQCSAGERVPCSGKPGAMSASAAPSPGDWPNISWLHLAVFPWYGHITSAHSPVTEPALPTLNIFQQSPPFQFLSCIWTVFGHITHSHWKLILHTVPEPVTTHNGKSESCSPPSPPSNTPPCSSLSFFSPLHLNFQIIGFDFWLQVYRSFHVICLAHSMELKNTDSLWQASQSARQACQELSYTNDFPLVYFLSHWPFPSKTKLLI